jgi:membrane-bound serine protease (ClpP class)
MFRRQIILVVLVAMHSSCGSLDPSQIRKIDGATVCVIPVNGEIGRRTVRTVRAGLDAARGARADAIILEMDSFGGRVTDIVKVVDAMKGVDVPSYAFVSDAAISGAVLIALSTDEIYMTPRGLIGHSLPSISGSEEVAPGTKAGSDVRAMLESLMVATAQGKGHNGELVKCMISPERQYILGDKVLCAKGDLLTLTTQEATMSDPGTGEPLLAAGIVSSIDELLAVISERVGRQ